MIIVITGLDGSGTSSVAKKLHELDKGSYLFKTPSKDFSDRDFYDNVVREESHTSHMLFYLSSTVFISDYIKNHCDYKNHNVYIVRYLIDTVVSNRVAGVDIDLDYNVYGNQLLKPDLTIFVNLDEKERQRRITERGKDTLDCVLDDEKTRKRFLEEFGNLLDPDRTIYVNNDKSLDNVSNNVYMKVKKYNQFS